MKEDLYRIALDNPYVYQALLYYERGDIPWDDMLVRLVLTLADVNKQLTEQLTKAIHESRPAPIIVKGWK